MTGDLRINAFTQVREHIAPMRVEGYGIVIQTASSLVFYRLFHLKAYQTRFRYRLCGMSTGWALELVMGE